MPFSGPIKESPAARHPAGLFSNWKFFRPRIRDFLQGWLSTLNPSSLLMSSPQQVKAQTLIFLYEQIFGDLLKDPSITELAVNRPGEIFFERNGRLISGPWYVSTMVPKVHHCMGGIYTDMEARALNIDADQPIPGLFAAGESTGGVHGAVRLGSCAVTDCIVSGRIAGRNAAKEEPWS